ncbi:MAG TPA: sigma-70 family RNA polymerase sigma factor [Chitinophagaceae bacterium]|nr:sigma-70 family RNA polymerase sigma factor [Chitinophagaceae bacterium]
MPSDPLHKSLTSYAYNILGSYQDAKDVVQEVLLERLSRRDDAVENEKAYLVRSVINRAINVKNRQKKILSGYPGNWLPEPIATEGADYDLNQKDILSYSLLTLMEKLDAKARAVFILKEAFDYDHDEIATVLGITVENSRKILSRARKQVSVGRSGAAARPSSAYLDEFINIIRSGNTKKLEEVLSRDVIVTSDGGGKAVAAQHPVEGRDTVLLFLSGIYRKFYQYAVIKKGMVNDQPALLFFEDGKLVNCQIMELDGELVGRIYFMRNPDKLSALQSALNSASDDEMRS